MKNCDRGFHWWHRHRARLGALVLSLLPCWLACAGLYVSTISPGNVPWPGGVVPYVIDPALSPAQRQTYLDGLREYELAANVHFVPRSSESQYILFKYNAAGPNAVSGNNPQSVEINLLTRSQICHEMGHSFGLLHEQTRADRNSFVNVLTANITAGNQFWFDIDPNGTAQGAYDFESVMHFSRDLFSVQPGVLDTLQARPGFERYQPRMGGLALSKGDREVMKFLYGAGPALSPVVTNTSEGGVGSLRAAIHYAIDHPGTTITFNIPTSDPGYAGGVFSIRLTGHLPALVVDGTSIDGTTQPGYAGSPLIVLDGSQILPEAGAVPGLLVYSANCTVKGLSIANFPWVGLALLLPDAHHNKVSGCRLGLDSAGVASAPNQFQGIQISGGASWNTIGGTSPTERNVIAGNAQYGIWISDANTTGNVVQGNYIGTNVSGLAAVPNAIGGLIITYGAHGNVIGGTLAGARNVISGNVNAGIWITGAGVDQNTVSGNYIGLNASGTGAVPNTFAGLYLLNGAKNNVVAGNVISGNTNEGVRIADAGTTGNVVRANYVGTTAAGNGAIGNGFGGITIYAGATGNLVGGTTAADRNVISGNGTVGLAFGDSGTADNSAYGNFIGTDATGTGSVPNGFAGVSFTTGASGNRLGDVQPGSGNLISGNGGHGVFVADAGTTGNIIRGNLIGTSATGAPALANAYSGVAIYSGAHGNVIGGAAGARNVISGNTNYGIVIAGAGSDSNLVQGNTVGLNAVGNGAVPNGWQGVAIYDSAALNQIGGVGLGESNLIAGNALDGIALFDASTRRNAFRANSIHDNGGAGIALYDGSNDAQPAPVLSSAVLGTSTAISGSLAAAASTLDRLEFFSSALADPSGFGEGSVYLGALNVTTNGAGNAPFTWNAAPTPRPGQFITATATNPAGSTSRFSQAVLVTTTDTDADGLPDSYENAHPGLNRLVNDAALDLDADGISNLGEFRAGTDPAVPASRLRLTASTTGSDIALDLATAVGVTYEIEKKADLGAGDWAVFMDNLLGDGTTIHIIDPAAPGAPRGFYRAFVK
jgi:parallel beta-helix repeat protein